MTTVSPYAYPDPGAAGLLGLAPPLRDLIFTGQLLSGSPYLYLPMMSRSEKARFDRYHAAVQGARYKEPGAAMITTASARDGVIPFLEKRAALQRTPMPGVSMQKTAQGGIGTATQAATSAAAKVGPTVARSSEHFITPGNVALFGGSLLGLDLLLRPLIERIGYKTRAAAYPGITGLPERLRMDELAAEQFAKAVGAEVGKGSVGLLGDVLSKAVMAPAAAMAGYARRSIFDTLRTEDDVLSRADPEQLTEAYHTMARFAPTLATDKNAVKAFLRESVLYGTGPNPMAIKQLAEAENAVNPQPRPR
jgi:hypothetical protein